MLALVLAAPAAMAQDKNPNASEDKTAKVSDEAKRLEALAMAAQLAEYGRANQSAVALLTAAQIMKNTPVTEATKAKTTEGEGKGDAKGKGELDTPEKLLAEAKTLAKGNAKLIEVIEQEMKQGSTRQVVNGPIRILENVKAGYSDIYKEFVFKGNERAGVLVIGDGDADIDLFVYDQNGNLIGKDIDRTSRCLVEWSPRWQGPFTIKIRNLGNVSSNYLMYIP
ncbi:hypothetical protein [Fundidesulfovibrio magnetotacticus]|nr:hypothetical protein [Fundidesulfovibrio magnetotacticus]